MKQQLQNQIYQLDPIFFQHAINCIEKKEDETTTCMFWGMQCDDGWYKHIKWFVKKISLLNQIGKQYNIKIVCDQVKQKFGEFTCYWSLLPIDDKQLVQIEKINLISSLVDDAYDSAVKKCWNTCQICGADGGYQGKNLITTTGWIKRICKNCDSQYKQRKEWKG